MGVKNIDVYFLKEKFLVFLYRFVIWVVFMVIFFLRVFLKKKKMIEFLF